MNYSKNYYDYIEYVKTLNRQSLPKDHLDYRYYERHHIIPKSIGGSNELTNLVLLTAREHFLAHYLLTKIYTEPRLRAKMYFAFMQMQTKNMHQSDRYMNSRLFEKLKQENSILLATFRSKQHWTEEQKASVRGKPKPPFSENHRTNIAKARRGTKQSAETICRRSQKNNKPVKCIDTGEVFPSIKLAAESKHLHSQELQLSAKVERDQ